MERQSFCSTGHVIRIENRKSLLEAAETDETCNKGYYKLQVI